MSKSWQSTVHLPKILFPPRPRAQNHERYLQRCTTDLYKWQATERKYEKPFILHDGPPYANGSLHVGHALNKILKDAILRVKVQQGHRVQYAPGWDCHGLPIELKALEAASGLAAGKTGSENSSNGGASTAMTPTVLSQMEEFKSFAVMADWDSSWKTMDPGYEIRQLELFLDMVQKGLIYRRFKPVYWSPSSRTALAEAEIEYKDNYTSTAAYVRFPILSTADGPLPTLLGDHSERKLYAVIWTTTPWTLPANKAIAVHDELEYAIVKDGQNAYIVAKDCYARVGEFMGWHPTDTSIIAVCKGADLRHLTYRNPLHGDAAPQQPILHADFVSADSGSGLVHLAPGHGHDDYEVCRPLGLDISAPVDDRGHFTAEAYPQNPETLQGLFAQGRGNATVLGLLGKDALHIHKYQHKYPIDWRTKKPVIIRATAQWFADVEGIKGAALKALDDVQFIPSSGKTRLESFVKGRSEWCISRQRAWGVPIPALYDSNGDAVMTEESVKHIISVIRKRGTDAWWSDDPSDPQWIPASLQGSSNGYRRGTDTMDVWFDSGSSWTHEGGARADVYLEGTDQHRGWFQSSLLTRVAAATAQRGVPGKPSLVEQDVGLAPFKHLITHGFTLDNSGRKMSKSLGNMILPRDVMEGKLLRPRKNRHKDDEEDGVENGAQDSGPRYEALGPDALRLWATSSDYTRDVAIGPPVLESVHVSLIKYRRIIKMLLGLMRQSARTLPLTVTDHIAIIQLRDTMSQVGKAYDRFEFQKGISAVNWWVVNELSAFYIEAKKDRLYCGDGASVLEPVFWGMMRMLAPITPLLVEEAWDCCPEWLKKDAIHPLRQLYESPLMDESRLPGDEAVLRKAIPVLSAVHASIKATTEAARRDKLMGSSLQCSIVVETSAPAIVECLEQFRDELSTLFVVSSVQINEPFPEAPEWMYEDNFSVPAVDGSLVEVPCRVWVLPPKEHKCPRCWRYVAPQEDALCGRCEEAVQTV
ncbi:hypothetical protein M406DRAFT_62267 [Cryphonectria parasitica EP155]|uniref:Isoleucine--tRNA ligase, mitochondrial n=1 Tax=Cryphonectria parasitica (strain ATCC 38755 / EP155) TaxID=660469 RepID=A0A9P5CNR3_CRYP1|nr:uncharacterized protein M406DRAFT_62267 [Cryphonectria parasitica EP155]KAF3764597.1 hypothetical protein M406DRAFT_62267 [Cryphonectria parasitica EP155]